MPLPKHLEGSSFKPLLDDPALTPLGEMRNLKVLQLQGTKVTAAGIATLQKALPNCSIEWDGAQK